MRKIPLLTVFSLSIILASCGSNQYAVQDNDGIYGPGEATVEYDDGVAQTTVSSNNDTFYKNYFKEKSLEYQIPEEEDEVFTDIDSYEGNYVENDSTQTEYTTGYAGWGQDTDDVTINIYNSGFNNFGWYNPYRIGFGWGYSPYWTIGWGHYGYSPYYYGGFYGNYHPYHWYGYPSPYYNYGYYGNYPYNRRGIAYHSGRRGNLYARGSSPQRDLNTRSTRTIRRSTISRDTPTRVRTRENTPTRTRSNSDTPRVRTRSTTPRTRTNSNTPRVRTRTTTPRTRTNSNTPRVRTRTTTPRRSSTINSSPSRTRSSGSMSSGGRRGGRG